MTVVYVDTVFALNGAMDYLLLLSAAKLSAAPFRRLRLALGAGLGGLYAVLVFLPGLGFLSHPLWRLGWAAGMVLTAYGPRRGNLRLLLVFLALSCALAGVLMMVSLFGPLELSYPQGIAVTAPDAKALLLAGALCCCLCATVLRRLAPERGGGLIPVKLRWDCRQVSLTALQDSGNLLTDPGGSGPVLVAYWQAVAPLLPTEPRITREDVLDPVQGISRIGAGWGMGRLHLLPYRGVGQKNGLLLAVRLDSAVLDRQVVHRQLVALAPEPLSEGSYQGVIGL